jgi:hypothetical protein
MFAVSADMPIYADANSNINVKNPGRHFMPSAHALLKISVIF